MEHLKAILEAESITLDTQHYKQLEMYRELLKEHNKVMNLTAIDDDEGIDIKHFLDSLLLTKYLGDAQTLCDVGSGAGFPGIVVAIVCPHLEITLVEPTLKRCQFMTTVSTALGLTNIRIVNQRAEDFVREYREFFDAVSARAVANLAILSELCLPLVKVGGRFLPMKGASGEEEYHQALRAIRECGGSTAILHHEILPDGSKRVNLEITKIAPTPLKYPRAYGKIKKSPL